MKGRMLEKKEKRSQRRSYGKGDEEPAGGGGENEAKSEEVEKWAEIGMASGGGEEDEVEG